MRLPAVESGLLQSGKLQTALLKDRLQFLVGEQHVYRPLGLFGLHLELPRDAGTYVDHLDLVPQGLLQEASHGNHVRHHPHQVANQLGVMALDQVDHRRAVRGDQRHVAVFHGLPVPLSDQLHAAGTLVHLGKAQPFQAGGELARRGVVEEGGEGAAQDGDDRISGGQKVFGDPDVVGDNLGVLRAGAQAVAAPYAALEDDFGVAFLDLDGLDRTASDTGVAFAALISQGDDRIHGTSAKLWLPVDHRPAQAWARDEGRFRGWGWGSGPSPRQEATPGPNYNEDDNRFAGSVQQLAQNETEQKKKP